MKAKLTALTTVLILCVATMAQVKTTKTTFTLKGVLLDSLTNEGEAYATVTIAEKAKPDHVIKKLVTDKNGGFSTSMTGSGEYTISLTSIGRMAVVRDFNVKNGEKTIDLGTLYIKDAANELKGVEIVMQKPLVKSDIDKIEYNIHDDPESKSSSLLEMLRKVPMVTVSGEDEIKVNGSSSFKVYVNGKPNNMMSKNPVEVLKSLPANTIKRVEVITNPGPKYDAEGVGGILNIITEGGGIEGYTATFSGNVSNRGVGGGVYGTVKNGKLTVSARYNYNYGKSPRSYSGGTRKTIGQADNSSSDVENNGNYKSNNNFQSGSMEASYEIDTLRLVSMSFGLWGGGNKSDGTNSTLATSPLTGNDIYRYANISNNKSSWYSIDGGIDYQRMFHVKDRMLTLSYRINTNPNTNKSYADYADMEAEPDWQDFLHRMKDQYNNGSQNTTEHTFQADFTTPLDTIHTIEAGAKYILRDNRSENDRYTRPTGTGNEYELDNEYSTHYKHRNDILAAYTGYGLKLKKLSGRIGVRYEHTIQDVKYLLGRGDNFRKDFNDIIPSASIGYKLSDMSNLRLGYNMRIYRPGIWSLNPYLDDMNPDNISQGNPDLDSEKSHAFNLSYSSFTQKLNINLTTSYTFTNNSIENVTTLVNDNDIAGLQNPTGKRVLYTTYQNIGNSRNLNISGYLNWSPIQGTRLFMNLYGGYSYMDNGNGMRNDGWSMSAYGGIRQDLPHDWNITLNASGQTPWITLQGKGSSYFDYGINAGKQLFKKRMSISVFARNFFKKYTNNTYTTESMNFISENWNRYSRQRFGLSVSYRIGELRTGVKKAERSISNDDVKGGGSGGGAN